MWNLPMRNRTHVLCIGGWIPYPLYHQGSPQDLQLQIPDPVARVIFIFIFKMCIMSLTLVILICNVLAVLQVSQKVT